MKKLAILVMAMVMVFGLSVGVMAELDSDDIGATIKVLKHAEVSIDDSVNTIFELTDPDQTQPHETGYSGGEGDPAIYVPISISTNTPYSITIQENVSREIATKVSERYEEANETFVWAFSTNDQWIVSPNVELFIEHNDGYANAASSLPNIESRDAGSWDDGRAEKITFDDNISAENRNFEGYIGFWADLRRENGNSNVDYDWTMLEADDYEGTIYATVEAQ